MSYPSGGRGAPYAGSAHATVRMVTVENRGLYFALRGRTPRGAETVEPRGK